MKKCKKCGVRLYGTGKHYCSDDSVADAAFDLGASLIINALFDDNSSSSSSSSSDIDSSGSSFDSGGGDFGGGGSSGDW